MDYVEKLCKELTDGNPGALVIINKLQYFTKWIEMLEFLKRNEIKGGQIWSIYKDVHHFSLIGMGEDIKRRMYEERDNKRGAQKNSRSPIRVEIRDYGDDEGWDTRTL